MNMNLEVVPYLEDLWRYGRLLTRNDADADDVVQEALARALAMARSFDDARPLLPWLLAIVRNTFITGALRKRAEAQRLEALAWMADGSSLPAQDSSVQLAEVRQVISSMPAEQAEVLHLVGVLGLSYREASEVVGVPPGTVMSRLSRARATLRENTGRPEAQAAPRLRVVGGKDGGE